MRPVAFGEALAADTRLTLFSDDKPNRFFTVIKFWMDETSGTGRTSGRVVEKHSIWESSVQRPKRKRIPFA
jgi:hypothetical protein